MLVRDEPLLGLFGPLVDRWLIDMQRTGSAATAAGYPLRGAPEGEGEAQEKPTKEPPPFPVFRDFNSLNPQALLLSFLKRLLSPLTHSLSPAFPVLSLVLSHECSGSGRRKSQEVSGSLPTGRGCSAGALMRFLSFDLSLFFSFSCVAPLSHSCFNLL